MEKSKRTGDIPIAVLTAAILIAWIALSVISPEGSYNASEVVLAFSLGCFCSWALKIGR